MYQRILQLVSLVFVISMFLFTIFQNQVIALISATVVITLCPIRIYEILRSVKKDSLNKDELIYSSAIALLLGVTMVNFIINIMSLFF